MPPETPTESPGPASDSLILEGRLRRLPPSTGLRLLQALSLWTLASSLTRALAHLILGYRRDFKLTLEGAELHLKEKQLIWGRAFRTRERLLPLNHLRELTLNQSGESPHFAAGLSALALGTFLGVQLMADGVLAGSAFSLIGTGALLVALGLVIDFFWGSGRSAKKPLASPELEIRTRADRGWLLSGLNPAQADSMFGELRQRLSLRHQAEPQTLAQ